MNLDDFRSEWISDLRVAAEANQSDPHSEFVLDAVDRLSEAEEVENVEVGYFEGMQMRVLRIGDARLPAKAQAEHGDAMRRIGVRRNHQRPGLGHQAIGADDIGRRAHFGLARRQQARGDVQA